MEILFEQDNEEKSVATLILDALIKVQKILLFMSSHLLVNFREQHQCIKKSLSSKTNLNRPSSRPLPMKLSFHFSFLILLGHPYGDFMYYNRDHG